MLIFGMQLAPDVDEFSGINIFRRIQNIFEGACLCFSVTWRFIPVPFRIG